MKAAIYGRYSTEGQAVVSIDGQFRNAEEFCAKRGFEIVARYQDQAISGVDDNRPGFLELLAASEAGAFDIIVVDETSRLTRRPSTLLSVIDQLAFRNQALLDVRGFDSRDQSAVLMAGVLGGMDGMELQKIKQRTHRGLRERAIAGCWTGGLTYGYRSVLIDPLNPETSKKKLVVVPEEAEVVREVFSMYAAGMSPKGIANLMNERAVASPGSRWRRTKRRTKGWMCSVLTGTAERGTGLLRNELYVGRMIWNKRRTKRVPGSRRRLPEMRPRSEWVVVDAPELRIVEQAVWARVQRRLQANRDRADEVRKSGRRNNAARYKLSGKMKCAICGSNFIMANATMYRCSSWTNGGKHCCSNGQSIRRDLVEPIVFRGLDRDLLSDEVLIEVKRLVTEGRREQQSARAAAQGERRRVADSIDRVTDAIAETGISRALAEKLRSLEGQLSKLDRADPSDDGAEFEAERIVAGWRSLVRRLVSGENIEMSPAETEEVRERLSGVLGPIVIHPGDPYPVAEVRMEMRELAPYMGMVAGAGFEPATFGL